MRKKLLWSILIVFIFFLGMASDEALHLLVHDHQFKSIHNWANMTPTEVESWIRTSLPVGTPRKNVVSFLNIAQIEHHGEDETNSSNILQAELPQIKGNSSFVNISMMINFIFENGYLKNYSFNQRLTGL